MGRARGRHEKNDDYLYVATQQSQLDAHEEQFKAHADAQTPKGHLRRAGRPNSPRAAVITPEPLLSEGRAQEYGLEPDRNIPGGEQHLVNKQVLQQEVPAPEPLDQFRGMMAHGVPPADHGHYDRDHPAKKEKPYHAELHGPQEKPAAVPVYIVEEGGGTHPLLTATLRHIVVPALGGDPVRICGQDTRRRSVKLMNSDATNVIRIAHNPTALVQDPGTSGATIKTIGGAKLAAGQTSYVKIETQDELWAITQVATGTAELNIIIETETADAG